MATEEEQGIVPENTEVDEEALIAEYEAERPARRLSGLPLRLVQIGSAAVSLLGLWWVFSPIAKQLYLPLFLMGATALTFLVYRARERSDEKIAVARHDNPGVLDWLLAGISLVPFAYIALDWQTFFRRAVNPTVLDLVMGTLALVLVLEATRRTVGLIVPGVVIFFFIYAYLGPLVPAPFDTDSHTWERLVGHNVMSTSGLFGVPLDVAATYIILFTIYGAVLEYSGASKFFLDLSFAAFGQSRAGPGRTVTLAGFLLGTVSGSGVATTVTLGGVSWPVLRRSGYPPEEGGGLLAAAGIGAILSPPTLGAAAFIIAELLRVSYLEVLIWATIPTLLYYLGIILAIEMDARRFHTEAVVIEAQSTKRLLFRYGYHFSSLIAIVVFMWMGMTPFRAVVLATGLAFLLSFLERRSWLTPMRVFESLAAGTMSALSVVSVMAASGLVVGVMTLTGLGLRLANIIVTLAGGNLPLTAIYSAVSVVLLGLAVPVTASFIISWVIIGPALQQLGVPAYAAAMFIFYYAVLSEVSPPTALSPFAASAITGGKAVRTMWLTWKYTLPAFLVPFVFVLAPAGEGLLFRGGFPTVVVAVVTATAAVGSLAVVTGGWLLGPAGWPERVLFTGAAFCLLVTTPLWIGLGAGLGALGFAVHLFQRRRHSLVPPPKAGGRFLRSR
ncbi:MAG: TRAP transporter fused permease subunit [Acidimicrobiia bacterium]|nr:TRAP transporter fused permease subunit [Acidimicrobiia bacterium]